MTFPRTAGCLLHPTSLPGPGGSGDIGADAYRFVDWLAAAGLGIWQVLPLCETGRGHSPYMSPSAFAGNSLLIDLDALCAEGWLDPGELEPRPDSDPRRIDFRAMTRFRRTRLERAAARFAQSAPAAARNRFERFCGEQAHWLEDYALFMALDAAFPDRDWSDWDAPLAHRDPAALAAARSTLASDIAAHCFYQWCFHRQWQGLRDYAAGHGIRVFGDLPIFVAYHSADVWANRDMFELDDRGRMPVVAGVPPDYFSSTGQLWGNPLYRWERHRADGYRWWTARIRHAFEQCDLLRIDHFLGFAHYWEVPADAESAVTGRWRAGPGAALFERLEQTLGKLPIVAENLGSVTPEAEALRQQFGYPGMAVLQFAFSGDPANPHLPDNQVPNQVVYSGTHDNDTAMGWWQSLPDDLRQQVRQILGIPGDEPHLDLVRAAFHSPAHSAIIPLQDFLGLGGDHRLNVPGVAEGNWAWRCRHEELDDRLAARIAALVADSGRWPLPGRA